MTVTTITANLDWLENIGTLESREKIKPDLYVWSVGGLSLWLTKAQLEALRSRINELIGEEEVLSSLDPDPTDELIP